MKGFIGGVAFSFLAVCGVAWAQGEPTWQLVQTTPSGDEYVMDHDLSHDDCIRAKVRVDIDPELMDREFYCELEN